MQIYSSFLLQKEDDIEKKGERQEDHCKISAAPFM